MLERAALQRFSAERGLDVEQAGTLPGTYVPVFLCLVAVYALTGVGNPIESVDGYLYAGAAEFLDLATSHDPRSLLFHKLNQLLASGNKALGSPIGTYHLLCWPTVVMAAVGVILMHRLLRRDLGLTPEASVLGAGLLATSYGYWRYAHEIEVYVPSIVLILGVLGLLSARLRDQHAGFARFLVPGVIAGLAVLYYQANAIPLFVAVPVLFLMSGQLLGLVVYGMAGAAIVGAGLLTAYIVDTSAPLGLEPFIDFLTRRSEEFPAPQPTLGSLARAASAIVRDILSLNWVYGWPPGQDAIASLASRHAFYKQGLFFAAERASVPVFISMLSFCAAGAGLVVLLILGLRAPPARSHARRPLVAYLLAWLALHAAVAALLDPTEMEVWIVWLVPMWAVFALVYDRYAQQQPRQIPGLLVLALIAVHNLTSGLLIFKDRDSDLYRLEIAGILNVAQKGDFVLFAGPYPPVVKPVRLLIEDIAARDRAEADAARFLTPVYSDGETAVVYRFDEHAMKKVPLDDVLAMIRASGRRLLVTTDTLNPPERLAKLGDPALSERLRRLGARLSTNAVKVHEGPRGSTFIVAP
ncbi:MAG: hypothetical protein NW217_05340 [Hyphomicrobiaceae bacterium]|nr:hypothetical protein [Hyphomicrobiaceae bacterium]